MANLQLAKNLFYLRTISGLKQDDIADIFNISRQACSNYETSTRTPDLGYLASFATHFHVTMDQLILCDLEAEHFIPGSEYPSGMRETVTPYMQGIEKIPVTTSISPKKKWILYSHSVLLPMRSVNSLPVFFTQINNCLSFFPDFFSGSQSKSIMNCIHCFFNIFFSAISTVIRISDVEIILILTLELYNDSNIFAATPGLLIIPAPTTGKLCNIFIACDILDRKSFLILIPVTSNACSRSSEATVKEMSFVPSRPTDCKNNIYVNIICCQCIKYTKCCPRFIFYSDYRDSGCIFICRHSCY